MVSSRSKGSEGMFSQLVVWLLVGTAYGTATDTAVDRGIYFICNITHSPN